jgi:hypothetical protein
MTAQAWSSAVQPQRTCTISITPERDSGAISPKHVSSGAAVQRCGGSYDGRCPTTCRAVRPSASRQRREISPWAVTLCAASTC